MFLMMNSARYDVGLQGLAIAERAYQQAVSYARDRVQGTPLEGEKGQAIVHHPDVLRLLTGMRAEIEAMRALLLVGGLSLDRAHHLSGDEAEQWQVRANLLIPVIKGWMTERSLQLTPMPFRFMAAWDLSRNRCRAAFSRRPHPADL